MGLLADYTYEIIYGYTNSMAVALIPAIIAAVMIYTVLILLTKTVTEEELLDMPKGKSIVKLLKKIRLLK